MRVSGKSLLVVILSALALVTVLKYKSGGAVINYWLDERAENTLGNLSLAEPDSHTSLAPRDYGNLSQQDVDGVEKFVFFVGYARSGSSIIGSMMDAHPNMIIANECGTFMKWLKGPQELKLNKYDFFNALYRCSVSSATTGGRSSETKRRKGYSLALPSSWQGRFTKLRVIGNKQAGGTTSYYLNSSSLFVKKCQQLETLEVPVHVIHVVRNPFDIIATALLYRSGKGSPHKLLQSNSSTPSLHYNRTLMTRRLQKTSDLSEAVINITRTCNVKVLHVYIEDFVKDPKSAIQSICDFLALECSAEYLQQCSDKAFKSVSRTRDLLVWSPRTRATIEKMIKKFSFFRGYSFESSFWNNGSLTKHSHRHTKTFDEQKLGI